MDLDPSLVLIGSYWSNLPHYGASFDMDAEVIDSEVVFIYVDIHANANCSFLVFLLTYIDISVSM